MINIFNISENTENATITFPCPARRNHVLVTVTPREIKEGKHTCSLNYRAFFFSSEMHMKLAGIKIEPKY